MLEVKAGSSMAFPILYLLLPSSEKMEFFPIISSCSKMVSFRSLLIHISLIDVSSTVLIDSLETDGEQLIKRIKLAENSTFSYPFDTSYDTFNDNLMALRSVFNSFPSKENFSGFFKPINCGGTIADVFGKIKSQLNPLYVNAVPLDGEESVFSSFLIDWQLMKVTSRRTLKIFQIYSRWRYSNNSGCGGNPKISVSFPSNCSIVSFPAKKNLPPVTKDSSISSLGKRNYLISFKTLITMSLIFNSLPILPSSSSSAIP
jgi:hypothetical protein